jgi:hypothetical protein
MNENHNVRRPRVGRIPHKTTSCSVYSNQRTEELSDDQMCHSDLYAYIKVFGNEDQRIQLVGLKSKVRRQHLLPLYIQVKAGRPNNNNRGPGNNGGGNNNNGAPGRRIGKEPVIVNTTNAAYYRSRLKNTERQEYDEAIQTLFSKRNYNSIVNKSEKFNRARNVYPGNKSEFDEILVEMFSNASRIPQNQKNNLLKEMNII